MRIANLVGEIDVCFRINKNTDNLRVALGCCRAERCNTNLRSGDVRVGFRINKRPHDIYKAKLCCDVERRDADLQDNTKKNEKD